MNRHRVPQSESTAQHTCVQNKKQRPGVYGPVSYTHLDVYKRQHPIFLDNFQQLGNCLFFAHDLQRPRGAALCAFPAANTLDRAIHNLPEFFLRNLVNPYRTDRHAFTAVHADILLEHHLHTPFQPFRVCTPLASQGTALEKDQCPDARTIVDVVLLYIEDQRLSFNNAIRTTHMIQSPSVFLRISLCSVPFPRPTASGARERNSIALERESVNQNLVSIVLLMISS